MRFWLKLLIVISSVSAHAGPSYLFGRSAGEGLGGIEMMGTVRYSQSLNRFFRDDFRPVLNDYGSIAPADLRLVIKDGGAVSELTELFVATLSVQKPTLMKLFKISNRDYNRLAAIAFGILGRETKFGKSPIYVAKEAAPESVRTLKVLKRKFSDALIAVRDRDSAKLLGPAAINDNSRGLTQIKDIPDAIEQLYCLTKEDLSDPRAAAVSTLGFLAESLETLRNIVRNRHLTYINSENIYDYVLYVYFGSTRQLVNPVFGFAAVLPDESFLKYYADRTVDTVTAVASGRPVPSPYKLVYRQLNETATPAKNLYVQSVKEHIRSLVMLENSRRPMSRPRDNACRARSAASN